jgi:transcriptional regulator with PAS, ATPase and Fis domain
MVYCENHASMQSAYRLGKAPTTIGRDMDSAVPVQDNSASRFHAVIESTSAGWTIRDLGSKNGTFVSGVRVTDETRLQHGAIVRVGDTLFKFVVKGVPSYQAYRIDGTRIQHLSPIARTTEDSALVGGFLMDKVINAIERIAASLLTVVITGETGTGKELAAREIHRLSGRSGAFQAINCAAIPGTLIESELFGYRKGAVTGADRDKLGLVKAAELGTVFLDEIGDMPAEVQVKLLRTIQFREVQPVGATKTEPIDVRFVCATNRDLNEEIGSGGFRADLFARLNEFPIQMPPLRARKEDIYMLVRHFIGKYGGAGRELPFSVMLALAHYDWPFNVRELETTIKRLIALSSGPALDFNSLPDPVRDNLRTYGLTADGEKSKVMPRMQRVEPPSMGELIEMLTRHQGNISAIARELGKERIQIHRWLKRHGLNPDDYRS